jgi:two-component system, sensor histidine kinase YesM
MDRLKKLKNFVNGSLNNRLVIIVGLFSVLPVLIISIFYYVNVRSTMIQEETFISKENLSKSAEIINQELLKYYLKSEYIGSNNELFRRIGIDYGSDLNKKVIFFNDVNIFVKSILLLDNNWKNTFTIYISNQSLYENTFVKYIEQSENFDFITNEIVNKKDFSGIWAPKILMKNDSQQYIGLYKIIYQNAKDVAVLESKIPIKDIAIYMDIIVLPLNSVLLLKDSTGSIAYALRDGRVITNFNPQIDEKDYIIINTTLINDYQLVVGISNKEINQRVFRRFGSFLITLISLTLGIVLASAFTLKRVTKNLNDFISSVKEEQVSLSNPEEIIISGTDEISIVKRRFKEMLTQIHQLSEANIEVYRIKAEQEMELLQYKINPHLLYNSLSVIKWLAQRTNDLQTVKMIDSLTRYYRRVLNKGNSILTFQEELELVSEYVNIMCINHQGEYQLEVKVDEEIFKLKTIKLIFQPIVENAIMHGLNGKEGQRLIKISGEITEDRVVWTIEDNGYGICQELLLQIMAGNYKNELGGYGMKNLMERIKNYYGDASEVILESESGKYTRVKIILPLMDK